MPLFIELIPVMAVDGGGRVSIVFMFVDVANSTGVFEKIDPEAVHQVMNGRFKILLDEVHTCEGALVLISSKYSRYPCV